MNIVPEETIIERDNNLSVFNSGAYRGYAGYRRGRGNLRQDRAIDPRTLYMRRVGIAMCVISAAVTLLSAALLAVRL